MRKDRGFNELRPLSLEPGYLKDPEGSCLIRQGNTWVLCTATVQEGTPPWLSGAGQGWITAEYSMLPRSVPERKERRAGGREKEISRMVGRALRAAVDLGPLDGFSVIVDCDVLQADGGTRCASVTGGFVALALALRHMQKVGILHGFPVREVVAGVSVAWVHGRLFLDPDYQEDFRAGADANMVISEKGRVAEFQLTGEEALLEPDLVQEILDMGTRGAMEIIKKQKEILT